MKPAILLALGFSLASGPQPRGKTGMDGDFASPPVLHWQRRIPGPRFPAAVHTERGAPVLAGSHIFVGSAADDALLVLDRGDGRLVLRLPALGPVQAAPLVQPEADRVIFSDTAGATSAYRLRDGQLLWRHEGKSPILATPRVDGDRVYVANLDNVVTALSLRDGQFLWRHAQKVDRPLAGPQLYGAPTPTPLQADGQPLVLAGFADGTLVALRASDGEPQWQRRVGEGSWPDIIGAALPLESMAVAGGFAGPMLAIDPSSKLIRWRAEIGSGDAPIALLSRDGASSPLLFHGGTDGKLRCLDARTGELIWTWDSQTQGALTQPVATAAGLLVGSSSGGLYLVDPDKGTLSWQLEAGYLLAGLSARPAVEGRQAVVLTNAGRILSLVVPAPQPDSARGDGDFARVGGWVRP